MTTPITPSTFFAAWREACADRQMQLIDVWEKPAHYTAAILGRTTDAIVTRVAEKLKLRLYREYYSIDAVFFRDTDRVPNVPEGETWIHSIQVAFEHENFFESGLFQETSHLLITRAELRVLVTYPEMFNVALETQRLSEIIRLSGQTGQSFLLITGKRKTSPNGATTIDWLGYTFANDQLTVAFQ